MSNTIYARALVPNYVEHNEWAYRDSTAYSPWIITHTRHEELENELLDALYAQWIASSDTDDFSEFIDVLQKKGYGVLNVYSPGVWCPIDEDDIDGQDQD